MNQLKPFLLLFLLVFSCKQKSVNQGHYEVNLEIDAVYFYGDSVVFNPVQQFVFKANKEQVTRISLGNESPLGVKVEVGDYEDGGDLVFGHRLLFFELAGGEWKLFYEGDYDDLHLNKKIEINAQTSLDGEVVGALTGSYSLTSIE